MSAVAPPTRTRFLLGAFGDPGHAFPMIALGRALVARGHEVTLQSWKRWREHVESEGMTFAPAPEYGVFGSRSGPLDFYEAAVQATRDTLPLLVQSRPQVVIADILTLAPALAAELAGVPFATLIPHLYPDCERHFPIYSLGARAARTPAGRAMWRGLHPLVEFGLQRGRRELNQARAALGLVPLSNVHGGISTRLAIVGTFPQLEYPRCWPAHVKVVGPLIWEPPAGEVALPGGAEPLVLIAPSTSQDPEHRLLAAALRGLARAPVRVIATFNGRPPAAPLTVPENASLVDWLSYSRTMPECEVVVCHAGHGTLARALASGCPVVACPVAGDMNENAARVDWAGVGVRLPRRFISQRTVALAVERVLATASLSDRARRLAAWAQLHDGAQAAARMVEGLAATGAR